MPTTDITTTLHSPPQFRQLQRTHHDSRRNFSTLFQRTDLLTAAEAPRKIINACTIAILCFSCRYQWAFSFDRPIQTSFAKCDDSNPGTLFWECMQLNILEQIKSINLKHRIQDRFLHIIKNRDGTNGQRKRDTFTNADLRKPYQKSITDSNIK